jgi:hypothetical protein
VEEKVVAPKTIERLEEISDFRNKQRKLETDSYDNDSDTDNENENIKIKIYDENVELDELDVHEINEPEIELLPDLVLDDIELI